MKKFINLTTALKLAHLVDTHEFFKFLLTPWAGAPLVIWFFGLVIVLHIITVCAWRSNLITVKNRGNQIDSQKQPPATKKNKQINQRSLSKSKSKPNSNRRRGTSKTK